MREKEREREIERERKQERRRERGRDRERCREREEYIRETGSWGPVSRERWRWRVRRAGSSDPVLEGQ